MNPHQHSLEDLVYARVGHFFDQLHGRKVPDLYRVLTEQFERAVIRQALERADGQLVQAAQFLDIDRNTLARKAKRLKVAGQQAPRRVARNPSVT